MSTKSLLKPAAILLLQAIIFLLPVQTLAQQNDTLQKIFTLIKDNTPDKICYTEEKYLEIVDDILQESGILYYEKPDTLIREQHKPEQIIFTIKGDSMTIVSQDEKQSVPLSSSPILQALANSFRAILSGNIERLQAYYNVQFSGNTEAWMIRLKPDIKSLRTYIDEIVLHGKQGILTQYRISENSGDWSNMHLMFCKTTIAE